ncbi:MAG: hypothetical protein IJ870_04035 [Alphaproteobacteria bacterium]|nr:hypothetical protein [Alphaproteobacteria bacterium]
MKVNVANYIYADLIQRFGLQNEKNVDPEIIDVLLGKWSNKEYLSPDSSLKLHHISHIRPPHLM